MKMTKKLLIGAAALVAAMGLMSCGGAASDDDPNKMISGKNSHYEIDYANTAVDTSRGYNATSMKHQGGLVKITIDSVSGKGSAGGVMGFIFDLKANANDKKARDFFIIGLRNDTDGGKYYVSKFSNVTNMQADNFGAVKGIENPAEEKEYVKAFGTLGTLPTDEDGNAYAYVYAFGNEDGSFSWKILNASATDKISKLSDKEFAKLDFTADMILAEGEIPNTDTGYFKNTQANLAVYANVYGTGTAKNEKGGYLAGSWDFVGTYHEADVLD